MSSHWKEYLVASGANLANGSIADFGNVEAELNSAKSSNTISDLSHLDRLSVSGPDAEEFLLGQFSNDIRLLDQPGSQLTTYCNPKGRMLALFRVISSADGFVLVSDENIGLPLLPRLKMFVMRSKVEIENLADKQIIIGLNGDSIPEILGAIIRQELPADKDGVLQAGGLTIVRLAGKLPRYMVLGEIEQIETLWPLLADKCTPVGRAAWEWLDIQSGIPSIHTETIERFIPQMLNLDVLDAINFKKGCYPGQEIIARMKYLGKLKQRMFLGHAEMKVLMPGQPVFAESFGKQSAGTIVNAQPSPEGGIDLLLVAQIIPAQSDELAVNSADGPVITIKKLPYEVPLAGESAS